jgi:aldehyde:ferredoxin oxidoreductase
MMNGYMGKLLFVDLSKGFIEERDLSEETAKLFIGGYGIGAKILYDEMKPGVDPLGPDNMLGFVTGPLTGTAAFLTGRYTVVCKSPVTGGWNDSNSGGYFGNELKKSGLDGIFVTGTSDKPVYLWINDGKYEIRDASALWGKDIVETEKALKAELGEEKLRAAMVGPAGEKLSLISSIMNDEHRAAGRGGCGAVMGSKKLKAVVVRGTGNVPIADPEGLKKANKDISFAIKNGPNKAFSTYGTSMFTGGAALCGDSPVKNWAGVGFSDFGEEKSKKLEGVVLDKKYRQKKYACSKCPIGCGAIYDSSDSTMPVGKTGRSEYETSAAFGCLMLNDNADVVIKCNHICNIYGLDTISVGGTVAWAIECFENGLFTLEETGGIELKWGNGPAIAAVTQVIADQSTEFGKTLALGSAEAAKKTEKGSEYLQTVSGIELPMHDPRFAPGFARTYQIDPTPARHVKGGIGVMQMELDPSKKYVYEGTGQQDLAAAADAEILYSSGVCTFEFFVGVEPIAELLMRPVTGWEFSKEEQTRTGLRIFNMRHAFNLREGLKPSDAVLPKRCVGEPALEDGPLKGVTIDHKALAHNFLEAIGWDENTWKPSRSSLEELGGMDDVIKDLNL